MTYVTYFRTSTKKQDLGIESQKDMVNNFIKSDDIILASFEEKESGSNNNRIELNKALALCAKEGATLLIAKLDRLARSVSFIADLMESKVKFTAIDLPKANELTIHIMAAMAQHELSMIQDRTNKALDQIKKNIADNGFHVSKKGNKITKLGSGYVPTDKDRMKSREVLRSKRESNPNNKLAMGALELMDGKGWTLQKKATYLNDNGYKTSRGNSFSSMQVSRLEKDIVILS